RGIASPRRRASRPRGAHMTIRITALGLVLFGCTQHDDGVSAAAPAESASATPTIQVVPVVSRQPDTSTHLEGELAPYEAVDIFSKVGGFVSKVDVDRGSVVKTGQVLVVISAPELAAQRAEAEAKLQADKSTFERFKAASQTPGAVAGHE